MQLLWDQSGVSTQIIPTHDSLTGVSLRSKSIPHFPELDGLRGLAALVVVFHHITLLPGLTPSNPTQDHLRSLGNAGKIGVDIFFVLSGFLITSILLRERDSQSFYKDFYWKRVLRVLPLYVVLLVLLVIFVKGSWPYVVLSTFFLANFASVLHIDLGTPFWSLAVEEQFYALWPTVLRHRSNQQVARFALRLALGSFLLRVLFGIMGHYNFYLTFLHCDGLALGAFLACRFAQSEQKAGVPFLENRIFIGTLVGGLAMYCGSVSLTASPAINPISANLGLTGFTLIAFGLVGVSIGNTNSPATAFLRSKTLRFFGLISYALYMIHWFVEEVYDRYFYQKQLQGNSNYCARAAIILTVSIGLSIASRYLIELPALKLRKRVLSSPSPPSETELPLTHAS